MIIEWLTSGFIYYNSLSNQKLIDEGIASYYSRAGCVGCSENLIMANGEPLNDDNLTVAYNRKPLNSYIVLVNPKNKRRVRVKVTDTGGFEQLGRVIDLSVATKQALNCSDLCYLLIYEDKAGRVVDYLPSY